MKKRRLVFDVMETLRSRTCVVIVGPLALTCSVDPGPSTNFDAHWTLTTYGRYVRLAFGWSTKWRRGVGE